MYYGVHNTGKQNVWLDSIKAERRERNILALSYFMWEVVYYPLKKDCDKLEMYTVYPKATSYKEL